MSVSINTVNSGRRLKTGSLFKKQRLFVWSSILPVMILFLILSIIPICNTVVGSFYNWNALSGSMTFTGLENYKNAFSDKLVGKAFANTFTYAVLSVLIKTVLALLMALGVNAIGRGKGIFRTIFFWPSICSVLATSFVFRFLFQADLGTINGYLAALGIDGPGWLQDPRTALLTIVIYSVWKDIGFVFLIFLAGIQGIPKDIMEAAETDGASGIKRIGYIVLPLLRPVTAYNVATQIIGALQAYTSIVGLTQTTTGTSMGGPMYSTTTMCVYIYQKAFKDYKFGYGSAISLLLFVAILILTIFQLKMQQKKEDY
jgi:multiple sugar transport system permease protein